MSPEARRENVLRKIDRLLADLRAAGVTDPHRRPPRLPMAPEDALAHLSSLDYSKPVRLSAEALAMFGIKPRGEA